MKISIPNFPLLARLPQLANVNSWSAPSSDSIADPLDAFLIGGDGYLCGRIGLGERISTMDRILAPHLSSYNFAENVNFRKSIITPSRGDFYPPFAFVPTYSHLWRVHSQPVVISAESDDTLRLITVSFVHPEHHAFIRYAALCNISDKPLEDIGVSFRADTDVPFPVTGHRTSMRPLSTSSLIESVEELTPKDRDYGPEYTETLQRTRWMVRGVVGARSRGFDDLFVHADSLGPGEWLEASHYLVPSLEDSRLDATTRAENFALTLVEEGTDNLLSQTMESWREQSDRWASFNIEETRLGDLVDSNCLNMDILQRAAGGWVVIDDYTGTWLRDLNGPYLLNLLRGQHAAVRASLERYYKLDCQAKALWSVYASDIDPPQSVIEPDWQCIEGFITGDVPNFRALQHKWYLDATGDIDFVARHYNYITGAFLRQRLEEQSYLASYCFDETYGIGPIATMRTGLSCDNSFNALAAAKALSEIAQKLGKQSDTEFYLNYATLIEEAIERTFWLEKEGYYAMRLTPVGELDKTPLSVGLLRPIWTGALEPDNPHALRSLDYVIKHLWQENGFIRLIPSHHQTVTMMIGYLIIALKKTNHPLLARAMADLPKWADASGTFGEYLDDSESGPKQCHEHMAHRSRIWESGINTYALLYALKT